MHYAHSKKLYTLALASVLVFNTFSPMIATANNNIHTTNSLTSAETTLSDSVAGSEPLAKEMTDSLSGTTVASSLTSTISVLDIVSKINVANIVEEAVEEKKETIDEIPQYFQDDYPDISFSHGTVATSGCGITCLAMAATYLLDEEYFPDELALAYNDKGTSNVERMEYGSEDLGLPFVEKVYDFDSLWLHLKEGRIAIALMTGDSDFTDYGHFIILAGFTEDGRIVVIDPYKNNYSNPKLIDGFENGFDNSQIYFGLSGAWVYEKGYVPEPQMESLDIVFPTVR